MILIISKNNDITTTETIKWLIAMKKKFIRIHEDEVFEIKAIEKRVFIKSYRNQFFLDEIHSVWYRRGGLKFKREEYNNMSVNLYMRETQHWLEDYVIKTLESKKTINKQSNFNINKLLTLELAEKIGLTVPKYFLAENTKDVAINETIIKSITGNPILDSLDGFYSTLYTSVVEKNEEDDFFITFFQEKVEKDFEIRCFYLNNKIWSTAIFSQNDKQTKIDHRKYNHKKPNRAVSYNLPEELHEKIHVLMQTLDLNCGSLDFIKKDDTFYFLEINTVGQFLGYSTICNFVLEKEIAEYL